MRAFFPSPLVGEGGFAKRRRVRGSLLTARPEFADRDPSSGALAREQPVTWVTVQTDDMGNTILVSFRSVVVGAVDPEGNA